MSLKPIQGEIDRGDDALKSAKILLAEQMCLDAMSRVYYSVLHYARAILLTISLEPKSHHGVFLLFNQQIVKTGKADKLYSKILGNLLRMREEADYITGTTFNREDVEGGLREAELFRELAIQLTGAFQLPENAE